MLRFLIFSVMHVFISGEVIAKVKEFQFDSKEGKELLTSAVNNVPTISLKDKVIFKWVNNDVDWPLISLTIGGKKLLALVDSGSTISAIREDSPLIKLATKKVTLPKGSGEFVFLKDFEVENGNFTISKLAVHAYNKAVHEPRLKNPKCCDMILGQDFFQAVDVTFDNKKSIEIEKPKAKYPKSSFAIRRIGEKSAIWVTEATVDGKLCKSARVDTAGSNKVLRIFGPWFGSKRPEKVSLKFAHSPGKFKPQFDEKNTGYVNEKVCVNLGRGHLFTKKLTISLKNGIGLYH